MVLKCSILIAFVSLLFALVASSDDGKATLTARAVRSGVAMQEPTHHGTARTTSAHQRASRLTEQVASKLARTPFIEVARKNFIDDFIFGKMERDGIPYAGLCTDEEFIRRLYLDLSGRIPDPEAVRSFVKSTDPEKRDRLVDELVGSEPFLEKWTYWFCDLFRNCANRIGWDGRNLFYRWVKDNLQVNRPYNVFVTELLTATAVSNWYVGPATYLARDHVTGDVQEANMHEDTCDEQAISTAKHFLGINLQCISCHDGKSHLEKINLWLTERTRQEFWQQAAFFGKTWVRRRVEKTPHQDEFSVLDDAPGYDASAPSVVRMPRRGKGLVEPAFILTGERPDPNKNPRHELARMITSHPQFARATVNLFWAQFMGVGIVDPPFDFDLKRMDPRNPPPAPWTIQPTHPELLEALAQDFREHNFDLQRLMKLICKSSAYQLSSRFPMEWKEKYAPYYARKFVRRLWAEEIHDAVVKATEVYTRIPVKLTDTTVRFAVQMRSPEELKGREYKDIYYFLESFGQSNREQFDKQADGSIVQAVLLLNSKFVKDRVQAKNGSRLERLLKREPPLSDQQIIEELFLATLSRFPRPEEMDLAKELLAKDRVRGAEDLQWALINKLDFIFNY